MTSLSFNAYLHFLIFLAVTMVTKGEIDLFVVFFYFICFYNFNDRLDDNKNQQS